MLRFLRRLLWACVLLVLAIVLIPVVGLGYGFLTTPAVDSSPLPDAADGAPPARLAEEVRAAIPHYQRPQESTFLTYPEWAIVYAAREYAAYVQRDWPSGYSYWGSIGRFWQDYALVIRATRNAPFNFANHQMLVVIGTSHTIENLLQWGLENSVGRVTEWTAGRPVEADRFLAGVAADYAAFLDQVPWYQYPYAEKRRELWRLRSAAGDDPIRTEERRAAFGLAYLVKQGYADLIKSGLSATAEPALLDIHVWAKGPVAAAIAGEKDTTLEKDFGADGAVFVTKRYQVFTEMIPRLIERGLSFVEIGGNDEILLTVLSPASVAVPTGSRMLFAYPLPSDPTTRRTALVVAVRHLHEVLPALLSGGARLEHVYDF
ncbi:MAG: hypothetical protein INR68_17585 [Methylobacterium mesophilicum]|nr:hypothetical protein [Methylobacterium mesophilicum]